MSLCVFEVASTALSRHFYGSTKESESLLRHWYRLKTFGALKSRERLVGQFAGVFSQAFNLIF